MTQKNEVIVCGEKNSAATPPRKWGATKLGHVRRRLVETIQAYENIPEDRRLNKDRIASFKALIYAYGTLASCIKDAGIDDIQRRLTDLEEQGK